MQYRRKGTTTKTGVVSHMYINLLLYGKVAIGLFAMHMCNEPHPWTVMRKSFRAIVAGRSIPYSL